MPPKKNHIIDVHINVEKSKPQQAKDKCSSKLTPKKQTENTKPDESSKVTTKDKTTPKPPLKSKPAEKALELDEDKIADKPTPKSKPLEVTKPQKPVEVENDKTCTLPVKPKPAENIKLQKPVEVQNDKTHQPSKPKPVENTKSDTNSAISETKVVKKKKINHVKPVISKNLLRKESVKIIRSKPKVNEEEQVSKQVSTSDETDSEQKSENKEEKSDSTAEESAEECVQSGPTLVLNGQETSECLQKPMLQAIASNKMFCLESKKLIFKKNKATVVPEPKEESPRKAEAFSADNENSVYAFEPDLPTTSPPFRRLKPVTPPKSIISGNSIAVQVGNVTSLKDEF